LLAFLGDFFSFSDKEKKKEAEVRRRGERRRIVGGGRKWQTSREAGRKENNECSTVPITGGLGNEGTP
jgi:hypothetical protein